MSLSSGAALRLPPDSGRTLELGYTGPSGRRRFWLHVPPHRIAGRRPLVVLLHGGFQTAPEFVTATAMSHLADRYDVMVAYPQQSRKANPQRFWNWFQPEHQKAGTGEPAILAGIAEQVVLDWDADPDRVFVAGFSAGGAMAAVLAATYPERFAAVGVHSGIGYRAADDVYSGLQVTQYGGSPAPLPNTVPLIVFHGGRDSTVAPVNAAQLVASRLVNVPGVTSERADVPAVDGVRAHSVTVHRDSAGALQTEAWTVPAGGHAWFGGAAGVSYGDPMGPSASAELLRFFMEQRPDR